MSLYKPADIPANPSAQLQVVLKWVDAIGKWDIDGQFALLAEDYTHHLLPRSLASLPQTSSRPAFFQLVGYLSSILKEIKLTIHEITECPGKVILHATSNGMSTTGHPLTNEYMMTIHLRQRADGQHEIVAVKEFLDSKYSDEFFGGEKERQEEARQTGKEATT